MCILLLACQLGPVPDVLATMAQELTRCVNPTRLAVVRLS